MLMAAWRGCRDQQSGPGPPKATGIAAAVESSSGQEQEESLRPAAAAGAARAWAGEKGGGGAASPAVASMATALSSSCHSSPLLLEGDDRMEEDHLPQQQQQLLLQPAALLLTPTPAPPSFLVRLAPLPLPSSFARTPPLALSGSSSSKYRVGPTDAAFVFDCCTQGLTVYLERIWRAATVTATAAAVPGVSIQDAQDVIAVEVARALFLTPLPEQYGRSALMAACIGGQAGTLRAVLAMVFGVGARGWAAQQQEKRAVLDRRDEVGATALLLAAAEGHAQVLSMLLEEGADASIADTEGYTPLLMAAGHGHTEATRRLLQHLTITHCCVSSSTPLPLWVFPRQQQQPQGQGQEQETEARAAVVNAANAQTGETALWLAVHEGHLDTIALLLAHGADPHLRLPPCPSSPSQLAASLVVAEGEDHRHSSSSSSSGKNGSNAHAVLHILRASFVSTEQGAATTAAASGGLGAVTAAGMGGTMSGPLPSRALGPFLSSDDASLQAYGLGLSSSTSSNVIPAWLLTEAGVAMAAAAVAAASSSSVAVATTTGVFPSSWPPSSSAHSYMHPPPPPLSLPFSPPPPPPLSGLAGKQQQPQQQLQGGLGGKEQRAAKEKGKGEKAFYRACRLGRVQEARALLDRDPTLAQARDSESLEMTGLMLACEAGHLPLARLLMQRGAPVEAVDGNGSSALLLACLEGQLEVVELLVEEAKADLERADDDGDTPLMVAAAGGFDDVVGYLLEKGADSGRQSKGGKTALHWAARHGEKRACKVLLQAGADAGQRDRGGRTPLDVARVHGHMDCAKLLARAGLT